MARARPFVGFAMGCLVGVIGTIVLSNGQSVPRAMAQGPTNLPSPPADARQPIAAVGRYQIASWAYPATLSATGASVAASHGAYVIDTQTGNVWNVIENSSPRLNGQAKLPIGH